MNKLITTLAIASTMLMAEFNTTKYEYIMVNLEKSFTKVQSKDLELCKIFTANARHYLSATDKDNTSKVIVERCQERITKYCGAFQNGRRN